MESGTRYDTQSVQFLLFQIQKQEKALTLTLVCKSIQQPLIMFTVFWRKATRCLALTV